MDTPCVSIRPFVPGEALYQDAMLYLLHPLDRYRTPYAIGSAIGRAYLALAHIPRQVGVLNRLALDRLRGSTAR